MSQSRSAAAPATVTGEVARATDPARGREGGLTDEGSTLEIRKPGDLPALEMM
jgi:hypothetical protein